MQDLMSNLYFYLPLGVVGVWRWGTWLMRHIIGYFYHAAAGEFQATVAVVTPVYRENPEVFRMALDSWKANNPMEIIAVIDASDKACIGVFQEFSRRFSGARLIVTEKPGKRPALADGARAASGEIIAFVDSDTVWSDSVLRYALSPFADPSVGGVGTRQNVLNPRTLSQTIYDIQLDLKFYDDMMPSAVAGSRLTCLSGRTALYRRKVVLPFLDDMVNEKFWGRQCIGGDDKQLTYLLEAAGWKAAYQHNAEVYTSGAPDIATVFKQGVRWSRNSWRANLRAMWQGWVWRYPWLAFILVDRIVSNFTTLLSPIYFVVSLALQLWVPAIILAVWWLLSRGLKTIHSLARRPAYIRLVPLYIVVAFAMAIVRLYALFTLNQQEWLTRGDQRRPGGPASVLAWAATFGVIAGLAMIIYYYR